MADLKYTVDIDTKQAQTSLNSFQNALKGIGAGLVAAFGIGQIVDYTNRWTDLNSRLVNATGSSFAAAEALDAISRSARSTYSDLEATADVFIRNSMAMNELGFTTNEQIKVSEALDNAIAVSGARGQQAASALDAFAKSIARGKFQGEDFNRIVENSPRLIQALADGLGVTTGEFRAMVTEGRVTSDDMIPALISQMSKLKDEADSMSATIADAFVVLNNSIMEFIGETDKALGISAALSKAILFLADNTGVLIGALAGITVAVGAMLIPLIPAATAMAVLTGGLAVAGAAALGGLIGKMAQEMGFFADKAKEAVDPLKEQTKALEDQKAAAERAARAAVAVNPEFKKLTDSITRNFEQLSKELSLDEGVIGLRGFTRELKQIEIQEKKTMAATIARIREQAKEKNVPQQQVDTAISDVKTQTDIIIAERQRQARVEKENNESFVTGIKTAMEDYVDNVRNGANQARQLFEQATQGMEDALINFVKTGKFSFKSLINDMLETLLRSRIQELFARLFGTIGGVGGRGAGSNVGTVDILGSIAQGVKNIFGGFFANGGMLGAGKYGIAGEAGPELISGPASVTPLRGGNVTYNINAVDARSFQELVASDPEFMFAVTEQGRKTVPEFRR